MYKSILKQLNFTDNEIAVYSLLYEKGEHTATTIAEQTNIKRGNVYYILHKLIDADIVRDVERGKKTFFRTRHPQRLERLLENKQKELKQVEKTLQANMGDFVSHFDLISGAPGVYVFEGKQGLAKAWNELLEEPGDIYSIEDTGYMESLMKNDFIRFHKKRIHKLIPFNVIRPDCNVNNISEEKKMIEIKYLKKNDLPFEIILDIKGEKTIIASTKNKNALGVVIVNPIITANFKMLWDFLWQQAK